MGKKTYHDPEFDRLMTELIDASSEASDPPCEPSIELAPDVVDDLFADIVELADEGGAVSFPALFEAQRHDMKLYVCSVGHHFYEDICNTTFHLDAGYAKFPSVERHLEEQFTHVEPLIALGVMDGELVASLHGLRTESDRESVLRFGTFVPGPYNYGLEVSLHAALFLGNAYASGSPDGGEIVLRSDRKNRPYFKLLRVLNALGFYKEGPLDIPQEAGEYSLMRANDPVLLGRCETALADWTIHANGLGPRE